MLLLAEFVRDYLNPAVRTPNLTSACVRGRAWACVGMRGRAWACVGGRGRAWAGVGVSGRGSGCACASARARAKALLSPTPETIRNLHNAISEATRFKHKECQSSHHRHERDSREDDRVIIAMILTMIRQLLK